jgi:hypothetical protein
MNMITPAKTHRRVTRMVLTTASSVLLIASAAVSGYIVGGKTNWAAISAHAAGYEQARYDFCNVKFTAGSRGKPYTDDLRRYEYVPKNTIVADAVCTDEEVRDWNAAEKADGSKLRACKLDLAATDVTGILSAAPCVASEALN